mmetsp:Transcript_8627/g.21777  ORF Transcript_8627/g.21777 Transcript_8627/m.21777 type:complete len:269 (+) Transcript_8627:257-1063(+)
MGLVVVIHRLRGQEGSRVGGAAGDDAAGEEELIRVLHCERHVEQHDAQHAQPFAQRAEGVLGEDGKHNVPHQRRGGEGGEHELHQHRELQAVHAQHNRGRHARLHTHNAANGEDFVDEVPCEKYDGSRAVHSVILPLVHNAHNGQGETGHRCHYDTHLVHIGGWRGTPFVTLLKQQHDERVKAQQEGRGHKAKAEEVALRLLHTAVTDHGQPQGHVTECHCREVAGEDAGGGYSASRNGHCARLDHSKRVHGVCVRACVRACVCVEGL